MGRLAAEGNVKILKVPTIANLSAPTALELDAGVDLTPFMPTAGVSINWTQNNATIAMLDESFVASVVGTESAEIELTGLRDDSTDGFWDAFERGENFYLVVGRFGWSGSGGEPDTGDKCEVYPVQSHRPVPMTPAENEFQQAMVTLGVTDTPVLDAVVG